MVYVKNVQISLVLSLHAPICAQEKLESQCEEVVLVGNNVPNSGKFSFDFSKNSDGLGNNVEPWMERYSKFRVRISASDHSLTTHTSTQWIPFLNALGIETSPNPDNSSECQLRRSNISFGLKEATADVAQNVRERHLSTTCKLSSYYSLGLEANFKSISLTLLGGWAGSYPLWRDNTKAPDVAFNLIPQTNMIQDLPVWTSTSLAPTPVIAGPSPTPQPLLTGESVTHNFLFSVARRTSWILIPLFYFFFSCDLLHMP
jgi:hypothetical protein